VSFDDGAVDMGYHHIKDLDNVGMTGVQVLLRCYTEARHLMNWWFLMPTFMGGLGEVLDLFYKPFFSDLIALYNNSSIHFSFFQVAPFI
jgi:lipoprotein signal peptidase